MTSKVESSTDAQISPNKSGSKRSLPLSVPPAPLHVHCEGHRVVPARNRDGFEPALSRPTPPATAANSTVYQSRGQQDRASETSWESTGISCNGEGTTSPRLLASASPASVQIESASPSARSLPPAKASTVHRKPKGPKEVEVAAVAAAPGRTTEASA